MKYGLIRLTRIIVSMFVLAVLTAGLTCQALMLPVVGPWLEKIQLGYAVVGFSLFIFVTWLIITLVFGRVYCSFICPMGALQDLAARIPRLNKTSAEKRRYRYSEAANKMRVTILVFFIALSLTGISALPSILEPFSAFTRVCESFLLPVCQLVAKMLAGIGIGNHATAIIITASTGGSIIATLIFAVTTLIAAHSGRTLCNTICPIGSALGILSRNAIMQMDIDTDFCIQCGKCSDVCKASCINLKDHTIDGSRCVMCFNCATVCPNDAIRYTRQRKQLSTPLMQQITDLGRERAEATLSQSDCQCKESTSPNDNNN